MHKPTTIEVKAESLEYAPTGGTKVWLFYASPANRKELRTAVADLYNAMYREGKDSKYTYEVSINRPRRFH